MKTFIKDNISVTLKQQLLRSDIIRRWHRHWLSSHSKIEAAVAGTPNNDAAKRLMKSRAPKLACRGNEEFEGVDATNRH